MGHNSPEYIRVLAEAMKIATRDKDAYILSDPRFVEPPLDRLLSDAYADGCCAAAIRRGEKGRRAPPRAPRRTATRRRPRTCPAWTRRAWWCR